jgi:DNA-binding phage protein
MQTTTERIGAELRAEIARQRRSATDVAERAGMVTSTLTRKLDGQYPFNTSELEAVTSALGITMTELFRRADTHAEEVV